jgi:hypothetical protein
MKSIRLILLFALACPELLVAQTSLTIYNQNFAVVRDQVPLDLQPGENTVTYSGVTAQMEPDSVVLWDPAGKANLQILDQSYRADTLSEGYLLSLNEGKTLDFIVRDKDAKEYLVKGKVIRSGYNPDGPAQTPIVEVDNQLRFSLPGEPEFPTLGDDTILKPALTWQLATDTAAKLNAQISYVTNGLTWQAAYNLVAPENGDNIDFVGWVTMTNQSGKTFDGASIKLMAGTVNKIQPDYASQYVFRGARGGGGGMAAAAMMQPVVTEQAFDEYHLYTLTRRVTLHDRETKQVEFVHAGNVTAQKIYVYDGADLSNYQGMNTSGIRNSPDYGTDSNKRVWVMREFKNSKENGLGIPLPAGRVRFYRKDDTDGSIQFVGENTIQHTPQDELVRMYTGDAFDIVGERIRTDYQLDNRNSTMEEGFQIKLRNHKTEPVEVRVVEHLYRWVNWNITEKSDDFTKKDAQTVEFRVTLKPDEEKVIVYKVTYNWK